jgi:antitoxin (DNA-binding transcriptional repressor) of toxin-antitoxin stability system
VRVDGEIVVTERGTPVARMVPPARPAAGNPFTGRKLLLGIAKLMEPDSPPVHASYALARGISYVQPAELCLPGSWRARVPLRHPHPSSIDRAP